MSAATCWLISAGTSSPSPYVYDPEEGNRPATSRPHNISRPYAIARIQAAQSAYNDLQNCHHLGSVEEQELLRKLQARLQRCRTLLQSSWYDTTQAANTWYDWTVKTTVCTHLENVRVDRTVFSPADGLTTRRLQASAFGRGEEGPSEAPAIVTAGLVAISVHACFTLY